MKSLAHLAQPFYFYVSELAELKEGVIDLSSIQLSSFIPMYLSCAELDFEVDVWSEKWKVIDSDA